MSSTQRRAPMIEDLRVRETQCASGTDGFLHFGQIKMCWICREEESQEDGELTFPQSPLICVVFLYICEPTRLHCTVSGFNAWVIERTAYIAIIMPVCSSVFKSKRSYTFRA